MPRFTCRVLPSVDGRGSERASLRSGRESVTSSAASARDDRGHRLSTSNGAGCQTRIGAPSDVRQNSVGVEDRLCDASCRDTGESSRRPSGELADVPDGEKTAGRTKRARRTSGGAFASPTLT
eukprot:2164496-Prymnesium_polylepis.1